MKRRKGASRPFAAEGNDGPDPTAGSEGVRGGAGRSSGKRAGEEPGAFPLRPFQAASTLKLFRSKSVLNSALESDLK